MASINQGFWGGCRGANTRAIKLSTPAATHSLSQLSFSDDGTAPGTIHFVPSQFSWLRACQIANDTSNFPANQDPYTLYQDLAYLLHISTFTVSKEVQYVSDSFSAPYPFIIDLPLFKQGAQNDADIPAIIVTALGVHKKFRPAYRFQFESHQTFMDQPVEDPELHQGDKKDDEEEKDHEGEEDEADAAEDDQDQDADEDNNSFNKYQRSKFEIQHKIYIDRLTERHEDPDEDTSALVSIPYAQNVIKELSNPIGDLVCSFRNNLEEMERDDVETVYELGMMLKAGFEMDRWDSFSTTQMESGDADAQGTRFFIGRRKNRGRRCMGFVARTVES
ncbi:hypothetical protein HDV00_009867 [Rhizophlyctis rosea]|nr:hypothetical protein HDV00_009867 [Rhizophlyctis rosea]